LTPLTIKSLKKFHEVQYLLFRKFQWNNKGILAGVLDAAPVVKFHHVPERGKACM